MYDTSETLPGTVGIYLFCLVDTVHSHQKWFKPCSVTFKNLEEKEKGCEAGDRKQKNWPFFQMQKEAVSCKSRIVSIFVSPILATKSREQLELLKQWEIHSKVNLKSNSNMDMIQS